MLGLQVSLFTFIPNTEVTGALAGGSYTVAGEAMVIQAHTATYPALTTSTPWLMSALPWATKLYRKGWPRLESQGTTFVHSLPDQSTCWSTDPKQGGLEIGAIHSKVTIKGTTPTFMARQSRWYGISHPTWTKRSDGQMMFCYEECRIPDNRTDLKWNFDTP